LGKQKYPINIILLEEDSHYTYTRYRQKAKYYIYYRDSPIAVVELDTSRVVANG